MQQELGSIINYCTKINNVAIYDDEVPEDFIRPSMYFPALASNNGMKTKDFSGSNYSLYVKVFGTDADSTSELANNIRTALIDDLYKVPLLDYDGNTIGENIRIKKLSIRNLDIDIIQITLEFEMEG